MVQSVDVRPKALGIVPFAFEPLRRVSRSGGASGSGPTAAAGESDSGPGPAGGGSGAGGGRGERGEDPVDQWCVPRPAVWETVNH